MIKRKGGNDHDQNDPSSRGSHIESNGDNSKSYQNIIRKRRRSSASVAGTASKRVDTEKWTDVTSDTVATAVKQNEFQREDHRALVSAIFNIGLKESSPLAVMEQMSKRSKTLHEGLNLERIKSKLQKYRKKSKKNKEEFMALYDDTLTEVFSERRNFC